MSDQEDDAPHNHGTTISKEQIDGTEDGSDLKEGRDAPCGDNSDEAVVGAIDSTQYAVSSSDDVVGGRHEGGVGDGCASGTDSGSAGIGDNLGSGHGSSAEEIHGREELRAPPASLEKDAVQNSDADDAGRSLVLNGYAGEGLTDDASKDEAFVGAPDRAFRALPSSGSVGEGLTDDTTKEEAFVDAPDQLVAVEGRNERYEEAIGVVDHYGVQLSGGIDRGDDSRGGTKGAKLGMEMEQQIQEIRDQLDRTRNELEQTMAEREQMKQELQECKASLSNSGFQSWQEERESFLEGLADLHHQLGMVSEQQHVLNEDDDGLVNRLRDAEERDGLPPASSDVSVNKMFEDCSKIIGHSKNALSERLQSEGTIRELHAVLFAKDQEIEDLSAKLNELYRKQSEAEDCKCRLLQLEKKCEGLTEKVIAESIAHDVAMSYMGIMQEDLAEQEAYARAVANPRFDWEVYLDDFSNGLLGPLAKITHSEFSSTDSVEEKVVLVQKDAITLIQKHEQLLYLVEDLGRCLVEIDPDITIPQEETAIVIINLAHKQLLKFKEKESQLNEVVAERAVLEEEKKKLLGQLDKAKEDLEASNGERAKAQADLEQSEKKLLSLKEKLSMAVTKGKSLVQQRDSLKQALVEKSEELEKCSSEIREKSDALEKAEAAYRENTTMIENELAGSQELVMSLQESLSRKTSLLQEAEEIFSQVLVPEEIQSEDITAKVQWLANEKGVLEDLLSEKDDIFEKLKGALVDIDMPQSVSLMELVSQVDNLGKLLLESKEEVQQLQNKMGERESAVERYKSELLEVRKEVEDLQASLLAEKNVKDHLQGELEMLMCKNKEISEKADAALSEKDELVRRFLEVAGEVVNHEELSEQLLDSGILLERCFNKIMDQMHSSSTVSDELHRLQTSLDAKDNELDGYKRLLDEACTKEEQHLSQITYLKNETEKLAQVVATLGNEKDVLQKDIDMADSKVQELEGCKKSLKEVSSKAADHMFQINNLTEELKQLAEEMATLKNEKDMLQKELSKSEEKSSLLREKLTMAVKKGKGLVQEKENWKLSIDGKNAEIEKLKSEMQLLESAVHEHKGQINNLSSDLKRIPDLESDLLEAKNEKTQVEAFLFESSQTLQRVMKSLESILLPADFTYEDPLDMVQFLAQYFHESQIQKGKAIEELQRAREEVNFQALKLADTHATIKTLEDALSKAETALSVLHEEKEKAELANETIAGDLQIKLSVCMEQLAESRSRLEEQTTEIDDTLQCLQNMKMNTKQMLQLLTERSSKTFDGLRKMEFLLQEMVNKIGEVKDVEFSDEKHVTLQNFEILKLGEQKSSTRQIVPGTECDDHLNDKTSVQETSIVDTDIVDHISSDLDVKLLNNKIENYSNSLDDQIGSLLQQLEALKYKVVCLLDSKECLKINMSDLEAHQEEHENTVSTLGQNIGMLLSACTDAAQELRSVGKCDLKKINGGLFPVLRKFDKDEEAHHGETVSSDDCVKAAGDLLSAVGDVGHQFKHFQDVDDRRCKEMEGLQNKMIEAEQTLESALQERNLRQTKMSKLEDVVEELKNKLVEVEQTLESALEERNLSQTKISQLEDDNKELQSKLIEVQQALRGTLGERNLSQVKISQLEGDLEELQISCHKLTSKLEDYQKKEASLREKEVELSSLSLTSVKDQGADYMQSKAQIAALCEKVQLLEIDYPKTIEISVSQNPMDKIFYLLDFFPELQKTVSSCIDEEKELKTVLAAQNREFAHLQQEYENLTSKNEDMERKTNDLTGILSGMEQIIQKLGGHDTLSNSKPAGARLLLQVLEKMVMALITDADNSKLKTQEMDAKLHSLQMKVDDLLAKNKLLEASRLDHEASAFVIHERGGFEPSTSANSSEISEIEEKGLQIKNSISSTSPAAHVRTMYKGSSEHLALNIDMESDRLVKHHEDDDKGHIFKSLNTSGLIPKQAKLVADRVDGIWVSGGRILMRRPGARISLIGYWILLHIWVLATIF